jgi:[protein-PII] uridylyltransferase
VNPSAVQNSSQNWDGIRAEFSRDGDAAKLLACRTRWVDAIVVDAYDKFLARAFPEGLSVVAVGGYGRRQLFPYSDIDLLLLTEKETVDETGRSAISEFLKVLWDSGLRASQSVRTVPECCEVHEQNIELNVSLLDQRFLCGDRMLYAKLAMRLPKFLHGQRQSLIRHLCQLTRTRHAKYGETIYHLEPNIKETPGGLRDYQLVCWLSQLQGAQPDRMPVHEPFPDLDAARDFLFSLRCYLHFESGRDNNVLSFDAQEDIPGQPFLPHADAASWMRDYFRHARDINRTALRWAEMTEAQMSSMFRNFRDWRSRVSSAEFTVSRERIYLRAPQQLEQDPESVLRLFQFVARHGLRLSLEAERRIGEHLPGLREYFSSPHPLWPAIEELFNLPYAAMAARAMHETGVLVALFPEWEGVECLVVRDFYHRYTVDEHTLVAMQALTDLRSSADPRNKRLVELSSEVDNQALLLFALLFHDLGKAARSGRHVEESLRLLETAVDRIRMPRNKAAAVRQLIADHLELSTTMTSRDLGEPSTARYVAERIGTLEQLRNLALITYADISAVNPTAMTAWRMDQLWSAYLVTFKELTRELESERIEAPAAASPEKAAFLKGLPKRYLHTHSEEEIEFHFELERLSRKTGVAVDVTRLDGVYRLTVVARDRSGLFASIAGALSGFGMNILKAEAFANRSGSILDTFVFEDPLRTLELNPTEVDRLRLTLERVILGRQDVKQLLQGRRNPPAPARRAPVKPSVRFDGEVSESATLIEIVAEDRVGLLYDLARAISSDGCNIEVVLIDTEAHRALDVFYVTANGKKLPPELHITLRDHLATVCSG